MKFFLTLALFLAGTIAVRAYEVDLRFPQCSGNIAVVNAFDTVGKSDFSIRELYDMQKRVDELKNEFREAADLKREFVELRREVERLEREIDTLRRK